MEKEWRKKLCFKHVSEEASQHESFIKKWSDFSTKVRFTIVEK